jgi:NitT/TauT family transport system substrate-binding protein
MRLLVCNRCRIGIAHGENLFFSFRIIPARLVSAPVVRTPRIARRIRGEEMSELEHVTRRNVLKAGAVMGGALAMPYAFTRSALAKSGTQTLNFQTSWLISGNQLGDIAARHLGYFEEEKIDLKITPGGPSIDGVAMVATGQALVGQMSSSPSIMLARSQNIPISCFGVCAQKHPYSYFSLPGNPVRTPADMVGKRIGIQIAGGKVLLDSILKVNNIPEDNVEIVPVGSDFLPLLAGQVDAIAGWATSIRTLKVLGDDYITLGLWDNGVRLYALPYYASLDTLENNRETLEAFMRAAARGWGFAFENPEKAVEFMIAEYPDMGFDPENEVKTAKIQLKYTFNETTKQAGWGTMDRDVWQEQITQQADLGQFTGQVPTVDMISNYQILEATKSVRPKLG